eukprot:TRINITY_DN1584_c0_g2_i4.p1 TRINITY_DN1584_c0_g2~~TRINITY_DN1584_c0_g2_i4.p1  ORF type:complete len:591 (+),score=77.12 TRINITY_DN1584_c0_g2_i4:31-1803(+)
MKRVQSRLTALPRQTSFATILAVPSEKERTMGAKTRQETKAPGKDKRLEKNRSYASLRTKPSLVSRSRREDKSDVLPELRSPKGSTTGLSQLQKRLAFITRGVSPPSLDRSSSIKRPHFSFFSPRSVLPPSPNRLAPPPRGAAAVAVDCDSVQKASQSPEAPPLDVVAASPSSMDLCKIVTGPVRAASALSNVGLFRQHNEDVFSIVPELKGTGDKRVGSFFGLYDGHGGADCAFFLRERLHQLVCDEAELTCAPEKAIFNAFMAAEAEFTTHALARNPRDRSGSCAVCALIIGNVVVVANVGDSRAVLSSKEGSLAFTLTQDHKPNIASEHRRITAAGGKIYRSQLAGQTGTSTSSAMGPPRVMPGRLAVSRTIGDIDAKIEAMGGNPNVVIAEPEVRTFSIDEENDDFIILASDGVFDKLSSGEVVQVGWEAMRKKFSPGVEVSDLCTAAAEAVLSAALVRRSLDNVSAVVIALPNLRRACGAPMSPRKMTRTPLLSLSRSPSRLEASSGNESMRRNGSCLLKAIQSQDNSNVSADRRISMRSGTEKENRRGQPRTGVGPGGRNCGYLVERASRKSPNVEGWDKRRRP